jgi:ABC-2 type transport system ATP-binding protein
MSADAAIRVRGLEKSFKELEVLRGVEFEEARGSIFALLGSNGAGKTTVVKILSTLLDADAGTAEVDGFDVAMQPANVRESISLTGQFAAVDEVLSGRENVVLVAKLRHLEDPGRIADDLLERFSLADAAERRVSTYSGGMRRRLDIAMSLIGSPPVIFLDEPTTGLDPQARLEVWQAVKELAGHGATVLLTTQYLDEAEQLADGSRSSTRAGSSSTAPSPSSGSCSHPPRSSTSKSSRPSRTSSSPSSATTAITPAAARTSKGNNDEQTFLR